MTVLTASDTLEVAWTDVRHAAQKTLRAGLREAFSVELRKVLLARFALFLNLFRFAGELH